MNVVRSRTVSISGGKHKAIWGRWHNHNQYATLKENVEEAIEHARYMRDSRRIGCVVYVNDYKIFQTKMGTNHIPYERFEYAPGNYWSRIIESDKVG